MSEEQIWQDVTPDSPGPTAQVRRRRPARAIALGAVAALGIAAGATAIAVAGSSSGAPTEAAPTAAIAQQAPGYGAPDLGAAGGPPVGRLGMRGLGGVVHGEFVVPKSGGGYQTLTTQVGTVSSVTAKELVVKSADGVSMTYVVTSSTLVDAQRDGIGSIKGGDTVRVLGQKSGSSITALQVADSTLQKQSHQGWGPFGGGGKGPRNSPGSSPGATPTPST